MTLTLETVIAVRAVRLQRAFYLETAGYTHRAERAWIAAARADRTLVRRLAEQNGPGA